MNFPALKESVRPYYLGRHYHDFQHVEKMLESLGAMDGFGESERELLAVAVLFHDIVYDPNSASNEEDSCALFDRICTETGFWKTEPSKKEECRRLIMVTKTPVFTKDRLGDLMVELDLDIFKRTYPEMLDYERGIFLEYQQIPLDQYVEKRTAVLGELLYTIRAQEGRFGPRASGRLEDLIDLVRHRTYRVGIYPGSFNPFHIGHLDILKKAQFLFDKVVIARGINPEKQGAEIHPMPRSLPNEMIYYSSLVTDLFKQPYAGCRVELSMIRGLLNEFDLNTEENMRRWVHDLDPGVRFVYLFCDASLEHVSSSQIKGLSAFDPTLISRYLVP